MKETRNKLRHAQDEAKLGRILFGLDGSASVNNERKLKNCDGMLK